jgi:hypothetical protein
MVNTEPTAQTQTIEEMELEINIGLSAVQCLPDFTQNISSVVSWAMDKSTTIETFVGDRIGKITKSAKNIGFTALHVIYEARDDYTE